MIAPQVVERLGLSVCFTHFDSTRFHVDGHSNSEVGAEEGVVHLTRGDSRDHRPDLNPEALQRIVDRQRAFPYSCSR